MHTKVSLDGSWGALSSMSPSMSSSMSSSMLSSIIMMGICACTEQPIIPVDNDDEEEKILDITLQIISPSNGAILTEEDDLNPNLDGIQIDVTVAARGLDRDLVHDVVLHTENDIEMGPAPLFVDTDGFYKVTFHNLTLQASAAGIPQTLFAHTFIADGVAIEEAAVASKKKTGANRPVSGQYKHNGSHETASYADEIEVVGKITR